MGKRKIPIWLKVVIIVIVAIILYFPGVILFGTFTDYKPSDIEYINVESYTDKIAPDELVIFDWNIGYAGLGKDEDFFLDGGIKSIPEKESVRRYLEGIANTLKENPADIYLIQEIDINSHRSNNINELEYLKTNVFENNYNIAFAINYNVLFVPVPFSKPMGKVLSGLTTVSKYTIDEAKRLKLPGEYSWPTKVFQLDRCVILSRIPTIKGKDLIIFNIHPSAYDSGGTLRKQQLEFILNNAKEEYEKGNYVIIGGDWNSEFTKTNFNYTEKKPESYVELPENMKIEGWKWGYDISNPTNRSVAFPYKKGENFVTVIDGYYVSPNIDIEYVKTLNYEFENSDHNPVIIKVKLK
ncbi:endonuclease/exonuclease/phosphatase family protein [Marinitoga litoralis]|uniref:endonuclease/exonuclease/phosphatase family protein n=1 Tax=Marinitoga litoralis TaxID=570855 RepID=UPI001961B24E|nr:endonuclease/exonuclease/phosphatase family protein [Marinitoga litoralis]MBM7558467.1 endonuclease/exonuclease/phosphatase family metal-dependent hydrolase [Marinitoga litoralis]